MAAEVRRRSENDRKGAQPQRHYNCGRGNYAAGIQFSRTYRTVDSAGIRSTEPRLLVSEPDWPFEARRQTSGRARGNQHVVQQLRAGAQVAERTARGILVGLAFDT